LGLALQAPTADLRQRFGIPSHVAGAVVTAVDPGGLAAHHDLRAGDVVVEAGQSPVKSLNDLNAALAAARKAQKRFLLLAVSRRGETSFKAFRVPSG
jgi:serine protease Do